jgi:hypothetical protein
MKHRKTPFFMRTPLNVWHTVKKPTFFYIALFSYISMRVRDAASCAIAHFSVKHAMLSVTIKGCTTKTGGIFFFPTTRAHAHTCPRSGGAPPRRGLNRGTAFRCWSEASAAQAALTRRNSTFSDRFADSTRRVAAQTAAHSDRSVETRPFQTVSPPSSDATLSSFTLRATKHVRCGLLRFGPRLEASRTIVFFGGA